MSRLFAGICIAGCLLLGAGCSKNAQAPPTSQTSMPPMAQHGNNPSTGNPMSGMPMMKENPTSIKEVTGEIQEVNQNELIVFTTKGVTLRFALTKATQVNPKGTKLTPGLKVTVHIQHVPQGMNAAAVDVLKS